MSLIEINWSPSRRELKQFAGLWIPVFAGLWGAAVLYRSGSWNGAVALWAAGALAGILGLVRPQLFKGIFVGWMAVVYPIGWVVSVARSPDDLLRRFHAVLSYADVPV